MSTHRVSAPRHAVCRFVASAVCVRILSYSLRDHHRPCWPLNRSFTHPEAMKRVLCADTRSGAFTAIGYFVEELTTSHLVTSADRPPNECARMEQQLVYISKHAHHPLIQIIPFATVCGQ
jgi:hypothetical protein